MRVRVIGIDCACDPAKVGLALGTFDGARTTLEAVRLGSAAEPPVEVVVRWMQGRGAPTLLALDAPLGWPAPLAEALAGHRAGDPLDADAHTLFRRDTDRFVKAHVGKQSLDVGADRIARTAHAALSLLGELRARVGEPIPLAWAPQIETTAAIEVYPAVTLAAHGIDAAGYKPKQGTAARQGILDELNAHMHIVADPVAVVHNADATDAVLCVLAAQDFLLGRAMPPPRPPLAEREGWIWVRAPDA